MFNKTTSAHYRALKDGTAQTKLDSCLVQLTGSDRHQFLHNFCTNEIKQLPAAGVCEAFILDGKGKILFHVHVLNKRDALLLHSMADDANAMIEHLDKYLLRDDVQISAISHQSSVFVRGPDSEKALSNLLTSELAQNQLLELPDGRLIAHAEIAGWGYLIISEDGSLIDDDVVSAGADALQAVRIENQTPWMGVDIDSSNLPQELLRDEKCISFTKGCYLGQETVARIDAIGRVNRVIVLVKSEDAIESGTQLVLAEKTIGKLLSASWCPDQACFLALAMVRRPHEKSGTQLTCGSSLVTVV